MYFDALLFLKSTVSNRHTNGNYKPPTDDDPDDPDEIMDLNEHDEFENEVNAERETDHSVRNNKKKRVGMHTPSNFEQSILEILKEKKNEPQDAVDEDKSFLLSLLPSLKKLSDEAKFDVKIEILNVLKRHQMPLQQSSLAPMAEPFTPRFQSTPTSSSMRYMTDIGYQPSHYSQNTVNQYWQNSHYDYNDITPVISRSASTTSGPEDRIARDLDTSGPSSV